MITTIVGAAKARSGKRVDFVIASNLALLDDTVLDFCKANNILLSTSLDGPPICITGTDRDPVETVTN